MLNLWYLTDFPSSQDLTCHFIVGSQTQIETHTWLIQKMLGPVSISHIGLPQAPSDELSCKACNAWGKSLPGPGELLSITLSSHFWYLTDFPPNQYVTHGHFLMGSLVKIEAHAWLSQKYLVFSAFLILGCLRRQAMNSALLSRYCLDRGRGPGTRHIA